MKRDPHVNTEVNPALPVVNCIWIGPELGLLHGACLRSFLRNGHRVVLHCYEAPRDLPAGVELGDASRFLPRSRLFHNKGDGSVSGFTNLLRYELLSEGLGLYVDCDVFCLRPINDAEYIFGWEDMQYINVAVLKLPKDCPTLIALRKIKDTPDFWPPWREDTRKIRRLGKPKPRNLGDFKLGTTGPHALTHYATQFGIDRFASPVDRFYPVHYRNAHLLADPGLRLADLITPRTDAIHLTRQASLLHIQPDSPIHEIIAER